MKTQRRKPFNPIEPRRTKPTPGPWIMQNTKEGIAIHGHDDTFASGVCDIRGATEYRPFELTQANARLIAAAPEMLEALKRAQEMMESIPPAKFREEWRAAWNTTRNAIAKAEGK